MKAGGVLFERDAGHAFGRKRVKCFGHVSTIILNNISIFFSLSMNHV